MSKTHKVLFASHSARLTGAPQALYNITSNLDRSRFEPLVMFPENGPIIERFKDAGIPTSVIDIGDSRWGKLHIPMIEALCMAKKINLIHANTLLGFPFVAAAGNRGIPCFWYIHEMLDSGLTFQFNDAEFRVAAENASQIGTVSHACKNEFLKYCRSLGITTPEPIVIHNGVSLPESCGPVEMKEPVTLLSIGNLAPHKGYDFLIDALTIVNSTGRRAHAVILGDGPLEYFATLWEKIEEAGLEDDVHFMTAELDVANRLESADIVVVPSLVENFSLAIAEAMAHGKPIVATSVGGTDELLTDGETGLLVPPRDPKALADAINAFIDDPATARKCGERARLHVAANFSIDKQIEQLEHIYDSLLTVRGERREIASHEDTEDIYKLLSEALASVNEKFRRTDDRSVEMSIHTSKKFAYLTQYMSNLEKDIRNQEEVVGNLLQTLPFRIYRRIMGIFRRG